MELFLPRCPESSGSNTQRISAVALPTKSGTHWCAGHYMLRVRDEQKWFFDDILGMEILKSDEVIWRPNAAQAPCLLAPIERTRAGYLTHAPH